MYTHSHYCPPPVPVGVDFYPHYIAGHALGAGLSPYANLRHQGGPFVDPIPDHEGLTSRFTYPPPVAYLFAPLSRLPVGTAWKLRLVGAVAGMTLALGLLIRRAGGEGWFAAALCGAMLAFYPLHFVTINGNVALVCLVLLVIGVTARSEGVGALFLALATVVKLYPGIFLLWLLVQRRWRLAGKMALWLAALVALTWRGGLWWEWLERAREFDRYPQVWYLNGSLFSVLAMRGVGLEAAQAAGKVFGIGALAAALVLTRRASEDRLVTLYQCGLLSAAILLGPATMYDYNLVFVLPAVAAGLWDWRRGGVRAPLAVMAAAAGLWDWRRGGVRAPLAVMAAAAGRWDWRRGGVRAPLAVMAAAAGRWDWRRAGARARLVVPAVAAGPWDWRRAGARAPLAVMAVAFAALAVPSHLVGQGPAASKFPWLVLFVAATGWRLWQLRPETRPPTAAAGDGRCGGSPETVPR